MKNSLLALAGMSFATVALFAAQAPNEIRKAPELAFSLPGQGEKLLSQYHGKVVALEFILTTCPHCQAASHLMTSLQQEYGPRGFQALDLAINALDNGGTPDSAAQTVSSFAQQYQAGFPVGWVPRDSMDTFMNFSVMARTVVPQLILIDRKGFIHYQTPPLGDPESMKPEVIRQRIEELLALPTGAPHHGAKTAANRGH